MRIQKTILGVWIAIFIVGCTAPPTPSPETRTPEATPTRVFIASPTPTPAPTATPTPAPVARVTNGDLALTLGDFTLARNEYRAVLGTSTDADLQAAALWGLGMVEYRDGNYPQALTHFRQLTARYPDNLFAARGHFLLGEIYYDLNRFQEAAQAYGRYAELRPNVIDAYAREAQGDSFFNAGLHQEAITAYQLSLAAPRLFDSTALEIKIARAHAALGKFNEAITQYNVLYARTQNDYTKAQLDFLTGQAYVALWQHAQGYDRYLYAVENYPLAYESFLALNELIAAEITVKPLDRGLVNYFAGKYGYAVNFFEQHLRNSPGDGTALYYLGLSYRAIGDHQSALSTWRRLIAGDSAHRFWIAAWEESAFTQWAYLSNTQEAAQMYLNLAAKIPGHARASEFLFSAARFYERANQLETAARTWERIADEYPGSAQAVEAVFQSGIAYYRLGQFDQSLARFQRSLLIAQAAEDIARAHFWIGKTQSTIGDSVLAQTSWQMASSADPTGYYSERAADKLINRVLFASPPVFNHDINLQKERAEAAAWVRVVFEIAPDVNIVDPEPLLNDVRLQRGTEYWELGLFEQANAEFESLRNAVSQDAADSFRLIGYLHELGMYRLAIFTARQVLDLAGMDDAGTFNAPVYFNHIRFGLYYPDLVETAAKNNHLHPLFITSVIRQESLFDPNIRSVADARGLMQIIPGTGTSLADTLNWPPEFTINDLNRPIVSITLGTHYLATNASLFEGNLYAALAAYNGGPGNALVWNEMANGDPDLLVEVIRFAETRTYIKTIAEVFDIYRRLYSPME